MLVCFSINMLCLPAFTSSQSFISPSRCIFTDEWQRALRTKGSLFGQRFIFVCLLSFFSFFFSFAIICCVFNQSTPWSSALILKISQPVSCNVRGTWYEVPLSVLPLVSPTATTAHMNENIYIKMPMKKMVEYPNDPPVSCTVCQPLIRNSSTHYSGQCLVIKKLYAFNWSS